MRKFLLKNWKTVRNLLVLFFQIFEVEMKVKIGRKSVNSQLALLTWEHWWPAGPLPVAGASRWREGADNPGRQGGTDPLK